MILKGGFLIKNALNHCKHMLCKCIFLLKTGLNHKNMFPQMYVPIEKGLNQFGKQKTYAKVSHALMVLSY